MQGRLYRWELALLLGVAVAALLGVWLQGEQESLADSVLRLHVIANSDSTEDQALKLAVRDRILEESGTLYTQGSTVDEVALLLGDHLEELAQVGAQVVAQWGADYPVTVSLEESVWFPTKEYTDFSLPAGDYQALQVTIGEGDGENWWCVVFPPLCLDSVTETTVQTATAGGLSDGQVSLMTGESGGYVVKFKALELWDDAKQWLEGDR